MNQNPNLIPLVTKTAPTLTSSSLIPQMRVNKGRVAEGWFCIEVPEGMDGTVWKFQDNNGQRLLMTVPPYLTRSAQELLLPEEVVERDAGEYQSTGLEH